MLLFIYFNSFDLSKAVWLYDIKSVFLHVSLSIYLLIFFFRIGLLFIEISFHKHKIGYSILPEIFFLLSLMC